MVDIPTLRNIRNLCLKHKNFFQREHSALQKHKEHFCVLDVIWNILRLIHSNMRTSIFNQTLCCQPRAFANDHTTLQWRHNGHNGVSNHQPRECLLSRLLRHRSKKTSKLRVTGLCAGNSPVTSEFPAQKASNAENFPFDDVIMINCDQSLLFARSQCVDNGPDACWYEYCYISFDFYHNASLIIDPMVLCTVTSPVVY